MTRASVISTNKAVNDLTAISSTPGLLLAYGNMHITLILKSHGAYQHIQGSEKIITKQFCFKSFIPAFPQRINYRPLETRFEQLWNPFNVLTLQTRKLKPREIQWFAQGHVGCSLSEQRVILKSSGASPGFFPEHSPRSLGILETFLRNSLSSQNQSHSLLFCFLLSFFSSTKAYDSRNQWMPGRLDRHQSFRSPIILRRERKLIVKTPSAKPAPHSLRNGNTPWHWQSFLCHHLVIFLFSSEGSLGSGGSDRRSAELSPGPLPPSRAHLKQRLSERGRCRDRLF